jgi:hypothetical protein
MASDRARREPAERLADYLTFAHLERPEMVEKSGQSILEAAT